MGLREIFTKSAESRNLQTPAQAFGESKSSSGSNKSGGFLNSIQAGLSIMGSIPVIGVVASVLNTGISLLRGNTGLEALSAMAVAGNVDGLMQAQDGALAEEELKKWLELLLKQRLGKMLVGSRSYYGSTSDTNKLSLLALVTVGMVVTKFRQISNQNMDTKKEKMLELDSLTGIEETPRVMSTVTGEDLMTELQANRTESYWEEWKRVSSEKIFGGKCWGIDVEEEYSRYKMSTMGKACLVDDMEAFINREAPWWNLEYYDEKNRPLGEKIMEAGDKIMPYAMLSMALYSGYLDVASSIKSNSMYNINNISTSAMQKNEILIRDGVYVVDGIEQSSNALVNVNSSYAVNPNISQQAAYIVNPNWNQIGNVMAMQAELLNTGSESIIKGDLKSEDFGKSIEEINQLMQEAANKKTLDILENQSKTAAGPCLSEVYDPLTGKFSYGQNYKTSATGNTQYYQWLENEADPVIKNLVSDYETKIKSGEIVLSEVADYRLAAHSEIVALDEVLKNRRALGLPVDESTLSELYLHNVDLTKAYKTGEVVPKVRCEHCRHLTEGINILNHD